MAATQKKTAKAEPGKPGRPRAKIDQRQFEELCGLQCSEVEICAVLGVTDKTLVRWCQDTYGAGFSEVFAEKRARGQVALRRSQFKLAEKNASLSIWLGKNYLGQREPEAPKAQIDLELFQAALSGAPKLDGGDDR